MNLNDNANIPAARVTVEQFTHGGKYPGCYCHTTALGKLTFIIFKITDVYGCPMGEHPFDGDIILNKNKNKNKLHLTSLAFCVQLKFCLSRISKLAFLAIGFETT